MRDGERVYLPEFTMRQRYSTNPQLAAMVEQSEEAAFGVVKVFEDNRSVNSGILLPAGSADAPR